MTDTERAAILAYLNDWRRHYKAQLAAIERLIEALQLTGTPVDDLCYNQSNNKNKPG